MEARDVVVFIDQERLRQRMSQLTITDKAGIPDSGQRYFRMWAAMDCRISTCLGYLHALGYDITISKREDANGEEQGV